MVIPISHIEIGQRASIVWLAHEPYMAKRLEDLGFEPDAEIECVLKGRKGQIAAYLVRGAVIALRREDANKIFAKIIST